MAWVFQLLKLPVCIWKFLFKEKKACRKNVALRGWHPQDGCEQSTIEGMPGSPGCGQNYHPPRHPWVLAPKQALSWLAGSFYCRPCSVKRSYEHLPLTQALHRRGTCLAVTVALLPKAFLISVILQLCFYKLFPPHF